MIQELKSCLQAPLIQKQNRRYQKILEQKTISYDEWIRFVESHEQEKELKRHVSYKRHSYEPDHIEVQEGARIRVMEYQECSFMNLADIQEKYIIFAASRDVVLAESIELIAMTFDENEDCELLYADEDEWNHDETIRMNPWFKPDFSPDTLMSYFYFGNLFAIRVAAFREIPWKQTTDPLYNVYDFCLKATEGRTRKQVIHLKKVLYHSHNLHALCTEEKYQDCKTQTEQRISDSFVSIIIPSKDHAEVLKNCIASIERWTKDINYEIIVVDNGSNEEQKSEILLMQREYGFIYQYTKYDFNFSKMCNEGASIAKGDYLLFLNDDIEIRQKDWLSALVKKAMLPMRGAVGAKLYYPKSKIIQHAGITNLRLGPVHKLQFKEDKRAYYFEHNTCPVNVLAVTGACLMMKKSVFDKVHGFDEEFKVAFNDVELCFRLFEMGYDNVCRNDIHLWHYESLSRGGDEEWEKQKRLNHERTLLYEKHPKLYAYDPYYHPYLCNDILDINYSCAYQYESGRNAQKAEPRLWNGSIREKWENECLMVSIEYADDLERWIAFDAPAGNELLLQGYGFVTGSNNARYKKTILLQSTNNENIYTLPCNAVYRPDLEMNLDEREQALLCGFCLVFDKESIPSAKYRIGMMAADTCSRQRLVHFTEKYITI